MMKVQTYKELEGLIPKVESDLEAAVKERESLGLSSPKDYWALLTYYNSENAQASAQSTNNGPVICVNALRTALDLFKDQDKEKLSWVCYFFDVNRDFLTYESWIVEAIKNPIEAIEKFEKEGFKSEQSLQNFKKSFETKGRTYESYKEYVLKNAEPTRKTLEELLPKIKEEFKKADLHVRHELDHADFFNSQLYQDYNSKIAKAGQLKYRLHSEKDQSVSEELAKANMEVLKALTEIQPIIESKAMFFDHIKPNEWDKADFEKIKNKVYGSFLLNYIERTFSPHILDMLLSQKWSKGEMDTETSKFLFYIVNLQRQSTNTLAYVIHPENVNYKQANKILYEELPEWKNKLATNARTAVEAISQAYKEDPSRLKQANEAKTFKEFIERCKGR